jgi:hypothetical protein
MAAVLPIVPMMPITKLGFGRKAEEVSAGCQPQVAEPGCE